MAHKTPLLFIAIAATLAGCASQPDIRRDKDPAVDLGTYKTFSFYEPLGTDRVRYATLLTGRLKQATRHELEQRGYVYDERHPDLRVNFLVSVVDRQEVQASPAGAGRFGYRAWAGGVETTSYRQGTLRVDLVDADRQVLIWQGVAEGRLDADAVHNPGPTVDKVVAGIFAGFSASTSRQ
jgi:hypothetical protein